MIDVATRAPRTLTLRTRGGSFSLRLRVRALVAGTAMLLVAFAVAVVNLASGDFPIPLTDVVRSLIGHGGAGTDFIGLTAGASTGALVVILLLGGGGLSVAAGCIVGCLITAVVIYGLTFRRGGQAFRLILMGIGVSALLDAVNSLLLIRARLDDAIVAQVWLIGSVSGRTWTEVALVAGALVLFLPAIVHYGRQLTVMSMGDEAAALQGIRVDRTRAILAFAAIGLAAGATAAAGPIAFVALAAPHVARRLTRSPGPGLLPAAAVGAALMVGSDWVAQRVLPTKDIPVGVVTAAIGGVYLVWLLAHEWRRNRARG